MAIDGTDDLNLRMFAKSVGIDAHSGYTVTSCPSKPRLPTALPISYLLAMLRGASPSYKQHACQVSEHIAQPLFDSLADEDVKWFAAAVLWTSCVLAGFGSEMVMGQFMRKSLSYDVYVTFWDQSAVLFPLLVSVGLVSQSVFGLPFLVLGLWKLGFPETVMYLKDAYYNKKKGPMSMRVSNLMAGLALLLHHSTTTWLGVCVAMHLVPFDRALLACTLPLLVQHMLLAVRHLAPQVFVIVSTLVVEALWEWEVLYHLQDVDHSPNIHRISWCMLVAHWLAILGEAISMFVKSSLLNFLTRKQPDGEGAKEVAPYPASN